MMKSGDKPDKIPPGVKKYDTIEFELEDGYDAEEVLHLCKFKHNSSFLPGVVAGGAWWPSFPTEDFTSPFVMRKQNNITVTGDEYVYFERGGMYLKFKSNTPGTTYIPKDAISHSIRGEKVINLMHPDHFESSSSISVKEKLEEKLKEIRRNFR